MMIRTYTIENVMKSLFSFKTFSEKHFKNLDPLSSYIVKEMKDDLLKNYPEQYNLFIRLAMQIYFKKIELGLLEIVNEDARESYEILFSNLQDYIEGEQEGEKSFIRENMEYIEDLLTDFAEQNIKKSIKLMSSLLIVQNSTPDQFILGPLISEGVRDVVKDVNDPYPLP